MGARQCSSGVAWRRPRASRPPCPAWRNPVLVQAGLRRGAVIRNPLPQTIGAAHQVFWTDYNWYGCGFAASKAPEAWEWERLLHQQRPARLGFFQVCAPIWNKQGEQRYSRMLLLLSPTARAFSIPPDQYKVIEEPAVKSAKGIDPKDGRPSIFLQLQNILLTAGWLESGSWFLALAPRSILHLGFFNASCWDPVAGMVPRCCSFLQCKKVW